MVFALALLLSVSAALLHGRGYYLYSLQTKDKTSDPNPISWAIWGFLALLNLVTYFLTTKDPVLLPQFLVGSIACLLTVFYIFKTEKARKLKFYEKICVAIAVGSFLLSFWSVSHAHLLGVAAFVIAGIPTIRGVWLDPTKEGATPWNMWTVAFVLTLVAVHLRESRIEAYAAPAWFFFEHGLVALLCRDSRKKRFKRAEA